VRAKDVQELMSLHTDYVKSQIAALTDQAKDIEQAGRQAGWPGQSGRLAPA
jgi:hypothetical protein